MMRIRLLKRSKSQRAQVFLEYLMMLMVFVIPVAMVINDYLSDSGPDAKDNLVRVISKDALGEEGQFGVIGAPYP